MKTLLLVRHAKSSWDDALLEDRDRPLNPRGMRDAPLMGKVLKDRGLTADLLMASPARRALSTAQAIAEQIGYPIDRIAVDEGIYFCGCERLLELVQGLPDASDTVFIVGHNPDFTHFVNLLADAGLGHLPTCSVAAIDFAVDSWSAVAAGSGRLGFFDYPKRHRTDSD
jgi:phosphohistidine phosphatase